VDFKRDFPLSFTFSYCSALPGKEEHLGIAHFDIFQSYRALLPASESQMGRDRLVLSAAGFTSLSRKPVGAGFYSVCSFGMRAV
jgi:hypothetical protein